ncbi:hypothetical protein [Streptomyces sp. NPDC055085]
MSGRKNYLVRLQKWAHGWVVHVDNVGVTQSLALSDAERMARDYISLVLDIPDDSFDITIKGKEADV